MKTKPDEARDGLADQILTSDKNWTEDFKSGMYNGVKRGWDAALEHVDGDVEFNYKMCADAEIQLQTEGRKYEKDYVPDFTDGASWMFEHYKTQAGMHRQVKRLQKEKIERLQKEKRELVAFAKQMQDYFEERGGYLVEKGLEEPEVCICFRLAYELLNKYKESVALETHRV